MARPYRMTAARRAALRKAQIAAAKKRKRRRKVAATVGGVVAVTAAAAGGNTLNRKVNQRRYQKAYEAFFDKPKALGRKKIRIRNRGMFVPYTHISGVPYGNAPRPRRSNPHGGWKVKQNGLPYYVKRLRPGYDADRRNSYDYVARRQNYLSNRTTILSNAKQQRQAKKRAAQRAARRAKKG